jgi:hypothetical protein
MLYGDSLSGKGLLAGSRRQRRAKLGASSIAYDVALFIETADELAKFGTEAKSFADNS